MKKICCVFNYPPFYRKPIFDEMAKELSCDFFFGDNVFEPLVMFDVDKLRGFQSMLHSKRIYKGYVWFQGCRKIFRKEYTDYLVTGTDEYLVNWLLIIYCKLTKKRLYFWSHGIKTKSFGFLEKIKIKTFFTSATGVFLYNRYTIPFMTNIGCMRERLFVLHNSLNTPIQSALYANQKKSDVFKAHFCNSNPTFLYIGRIQKRKKLDQLISAIELMKSNGCKVNLAIVGDVADDVTLPLLVEEKRLTDSVWFYGASYDERKNAELIYNACACVSPGNVGLTAIHSLSYGTPVITNDNYTTQMPEFESIIDGVTGSFYREDDIEDLARHMLYWANRSDDEIDSTKKKCRDIVEREWSLSYQMSIFKSVFKNDEG